MNSDPYDSAAWRTFGMLDADESAIFDEVMRHDPVLRSAYREMDRLSASIAAATAAPMEPRVGQLERLQNRLGLNASKRSYFWLGISGWAAAAVLGTMLLLDRTGSLGKAQQGTLTASAASSGSSGQATAPQSNGINPALASPAAHPENPAAATAPLAGKTKDGKTTAKVETKRLVQEIEVLRENLEKFQHRDRVLFEAVPGMALPIVMTMNPPGVAVEDSATAAKIDGHSPITALLGDALTTLTGASTSGTEEMDPSADPATTPAAVTPKKTLLQSDHPTAIPIYDAARDAGALVVSNLPPAADGEVYNLWVTTVTGGKPIYVGSLPESSASGADSFDFSLGSTMVLPSGFVLTRDPQDKPADPTEANTILLGPPMPGR